MQTENTIIPPASISFMNIITLFQTCFFTYFLSSFDLGYIFFPKNSAIFQNFRNMLIITSIVLQFSLILFTRRTKVDYKPYLMIFYSSYAIFNLFFISTPYYSIYPSSLFALSTKSLVYWGFLALNTYVTSFVATYIYKKSFIGPQFTESSGIFANFQEKLHIIFSKAKFFLYINLSTNLFFVFVFIILNRLVFSGFLRIFGIEISVNSIEIIKIIVIFSINNFAFILIAQIVNELVIYNASFKLPNRIQKLNNQTESCKYTFLHIITELYQKNIQIELMKHPNFLCKINDYFEEELKSLNEECDKLINSKQVLEDSLYVSVPQIDKNYTKKNKVYHLYLYFQNYFDFLFKKLIFPLKYDFHYGNIKRIVNLSKKVKLRENVNLFNMKSSILNMIIDKIDNLNEKSNMNLSKSVFYEYQQFFS